jgi:hypothetical protein
MIEGPGNVADLAERFENALYNIARGKGLRLALRRNLMPIISRSLRGKPSTAAFPFPRGRTTSRRLPALRSRRPRGRRSGRHLFQLPCVFLFEALDEPTSRATRRTVGSIDGRHRYCVIPSGCIFGRDLNECAACQVGFDQVQRQGAKPEARAQKGKFGAELGKAPGSRIPGSGYKRSREIRRIDVCEEDVLVENGFRNRPAAGCERVL